MDTQENNTQGDRIHPLPSSKLNKVKMWNYVFLFQQGDLHLTRALLLLGANFNLRDNEDKTPKDYLKSIRDTDSRHDISETFDLFCYGKFNYSTFIIQGYDN